MRGALVVMGLALSAGACAGPPRAPAGSCMQQTMDSLQLEGLSDLRRHCVAAGTIAARCGSTDAFVAGHAKEAADFFGPGDVSREDLRANRAGRNCARTGERLDECCARAGY